MWQMQLGMGLASSMMGASAAKNQAAMQKAQIEWNNHLGELQMDAENRAIAQKNAEQWALNWDIFDASIEKHALNQFYSEMNYENTSGTMSLQEKALSDTLDSSIERRGMTNSQTANAILNQSREMREKNRTIQAVGHSNEQIDIDAQRDNELSTRNFGSLPHKNFIPASSDHIDPSGTFMNTLLPSIGQNILGAVVGQQQQGIQNQQTQLLEQQTQWYNELLNPWQGVPYRMGGN